jgi:uncharacterized protein YecT (DUF1311 family)
MRATALFACIIASMTPCLAEKESKPWPDDAEVAENSQSPNGRYGVLLPSFDNSDPDDEARTIDKLVDLKAHREIAPIRNAHYFPRKNHFSLNAQWAPDSSWCAVTYNWRFGFSAITLLEMHGDKCTQHDVGAHIQKQLDAIIRQQAGNSGDNTADAGAHFHPGSGRTVLVRAVGLTNPKQFQDLPTYNAAFEGAYDLATGKWTRSAARKVTTEQREAMDTAYNIWDDGGVSYSSEDEKLGAYDQALNEVYGALRKILPADRFATLKKEQIGWLKKYEALPSPEAKAKALRARILELHNIAWE